MRTKEEALDALREAKASKNPIDLVAFEPAMPMGINAAQQYDGMLARKNELTRTSAGGDVAALVKNMKKS